MAAGDEFSIGVEDKNVWAWGKADSAQVYPAQKEELRISIASYTLCPTRCGMSWQFTSVKQYARQLSKECVARHSMFKYTLTLSCCAFPCVTEAWSDNCGCEALCLQAVVHCHTEGSLGIWEALDVSRDCECGISIM